MRVASFPAGRQWTDLGGRAAPAAPARMVYQSGDVKSALLSVLTRRYETFALSHDA
jgi:hypothetical protein